MNKKIMKILLIYNPKAGGGKALQKLEKVKQLLTTYLIDFELILTNFKGHATEIVANCKLKLYDGIIAAGGDGTFFEVLNGYFNNPVKLDIPIGILPVGTGNSLAKDILLDNNDIESFVALIKKGNKRPIDVIKVNCNDKEFYFANTMGLGFVSDVIVTASRLKFFGKLSYTLAVIYNTIKLKVFPVKMIVDGRELKLDNVFISFSNSKYTGGNYLLAPTAKIDDGLMDLIVVNKLGRINLLKTFPKIFSGEHVKTRFVDTMHAKNIVIETNSVKLLSPDGEIFGTTPAEISCIQGAIHLFME
jgi:YegS/Rv2252/BmrU family lipid kinase